MFLLHKASGSKLFSIGEDPDCFYCLLVGKVSLRVMRRGVNEDDDLKEVEVAQLKVGESIGDHAIINKKKRSATLVCLEDCELLAIKADVFYRKFRVYT